MKINENPKWKDDAIDTLKWGADVVGSRLVEKWWTEEVFGGVKGTSSLGISGSIGAGGLVSGSGKVITADSSGNIGFLSAEGGYMGAPFSAAANAGIVAEVTNAPNIFELTEGINYNLGGTVSGIPGVGADYLFGGISPSTGKGIHGLSLSVELAAAYTAPTVPAEFHFGASTSSGYMHAINIYDVLGLPRPR